MDKLNQTARAMRWGATLIVVVALGTIGTTLMARRSLASFPTPIAQSNPAQQKAEADRLFNQGQEQYNTSQFERALQSWQQALVIYRQLNDREEEGRALGNLGLAYYSLGNYPKAIEFYQQSLAIFREIKDRKGEGQSLGNIGVAYGALGDYPKAIEYQQQRLTIAREIKDRRGEGNALGNLGVAYFSLGNYPKAIEFQQQSLSITREIKNRLEEGQSLGDLGIAYGALGDYPKAIEYQQQRLAIAREIKDRLGEGNALGNLGVCYFSLGNYPKAIEYQQQRLTIAREIKDRQGEGNALGNLGNAYRALEDYLKAIDYYQQSLVISRTVKDRLREGQSLGNLGVAYYFLGNYSKAIDYEQQRLTITREIKDRLGEGQSLNNLGLALFRVGRLADAEVPLLNSIQVYESLRDKLSDADRISLADTQRQAYNNLQQVLVAQKKVTQALEIAERGRARAFVQLLSSRLNQQTSEQSVPVPSINLEQMQQVARTQKATLVSYSVVYHKQLFIWVIQPTGAVAFRQVDLKPLQKQQTSLDKLIAIARCFGDSGCEQRITERRSVSRGTSLPETRTFVFNQAAADRLAVTLPASPSPQDNPALHQLHDMLIQPIADLLPQDPNAQLIFIPQDSLFLVPFAALQASDGTYLIDHHTIRLSPSIQVLQLTHQQQAQVKQAGLTQALVVGNPTMPLSLPSLPGAEQEAKTIASLLGTKALTGGQATKARVLQLMSQARIIHLATHGKANDEQGLQSWIALAPSGKDSGFLTADEILNLKLRAELVVLSACETGQGRISGDGVIGLSRSMISAGVPSVLVSLWSVDDAATLQLMTRFYQELQRNPNKARALRQAMLATKQTDASPEQWAAFILIGEVE